MTAFCSRAETAAQRSAGSESGLPSRTAQWNVLRYLRLLNTALPAADEMQQIRENGRSRRFGDDPHAPSVTGALRIDAHEDDGSSCVVSCEPGQILRVGDGGEDDVDPEVTQHPQGRLHIRGDERPEGMAAQCGDEPGKISRTDQEDGAN